MLTRTFARLAFASALLVTCAFAMTNEDLIKLTKAGLSEDTILRALEGQTAEFDTSADGLIELKEAGVSEAVINRVIALTKPGASAAAARTSAPSPASPAAAQTSDLFEQEFPSIAPPMITPEVGQPYFTRFTLNYERGKWRATNYGRGILLPINTPVRLLSMGKEQMLLLRTDTNEEIVVENNEDHTRKSMLDLAALVLSAEKTPIDRLPTSVSSAIRSGEMRRGMTKEQVLMARGYPPAHETPSTEGDRWVYWNSRFVKQTIVFSNGRLVDGRGIY